MSEKKGRERRQNDRYPTHIQVDYSRGDNFLFSYIENISIMGIFIYTEEPFAVGTELQMRFGREGEPPLDVQGTVAWVNPMRGIDDINPGMGVRFENLTPEAREQIVNLVQSIAYLDDTGEGPLN